MKHSELIGRRIQYRKSGSRNGWTGTIQNVTYDSTMPGDFAVDILYDNGVEQRYCIEALEGYGVPVRYPEAAGYLQFISRKGHCKYILIDVAADKVVGCTDAHSEIEQIANNYIGHSQKEVIVYIAHARLKREIPPIQETRL